MKKLENRLFELLSTEWCGNDSPPLRYKKLTYGRKWGGESIVSFENDSGELGFGYPDKWKMFIDRKDFHIIVRWYLKQWSWGEWFGLRRWIWYKLLHRRVEATMRANKRRQK